LPDYLYRCVEYLVSVEYPDALAWIVCHEGEDDAPYRFEGITPNIRISSKAELQEIDSWNPDLIYVAGWADKKYNKIAGRWKAKVPVILGVDNPWKGTIKQRIATIFAGNFLNNIATHVWVPGCRQYEFVRRLGFSPSKILFHLYCADSRKFYRTDMPFRKRIIYAGRMVAYKRPDWLTEVFASLITTFPELGDWELLMVGNGPLYEPLKQQYGGFSQISMMPFTQPEKLVELYHDSCIFCMPSLNEHWGVVAHEAAAAGLALLLSDSYGAASAFLIHGFNGYVFRSKEKYHFQQQLLNLMRLEEQDLTTMGKRSRQLSATINHTTWSANLTSVLNDA